MHVLLQTMMYVYVHIYIFVYDDTISFSEKIGYIFLPRN